MIQAASLFPADLAEPSPFVSELLPVRVLRSKKRKRSVGARMVDGVLEVSIPAWMSKAEEGKWVDEMRRRSLRTEKGKGKGKGKGSSDLESRAQTLAGTWGFPVPTSVRWSPNMAHRWGSCTTVDGTIRISSRLVNVPDWVLDAVLIHELAHLVHSDHSAAFWALVKRYPKHDMAAGFLEGMTYASSSSPPAP